MGQRGTEGRSGVTRHTAAGAWGGATEEQMRQYPDNDDDLKDLAELNVEPWMADLLKMNPEYVHWGPHEDYMWKEGEGWDARIVKPTWAEFGPWGLDELNEVVHFYFQVNRASEECPTCGGRGYHPDALWISESFYHHSSPFSSPTLAETQVSTFMRRLGVKSSACVHGYDGFPDDATLAKYGPQFREFCEAMANGDGHWDDKITQDEVASLVEAGRLHDFTSEWTAEKGWVRKQGATVTAEEVNAAQAERGIGRSHDGINRMILVEARCKRLGVPTQCPECSGKGYRYTEPAGHVGVVLWVLHPRKGCSRGVEVERLTREDVPAVLAYLREAAKRNAERFAKVLEA